MRSYLAILPVLLLTACMTGEPSDGASSASSSLSVASDASANIRITDPAPNALVQSPLTVSGEARGTWYFEASFPVRVLDANGVELAVVPAQAQGEWMTEDFVPFEATLVFAATTPTGTVVFEKDNPSGLPEHAAQVNIPVRFQ